jgi:cold shock CspA family protein/tetratricopeptide (TPR) repeat protein
VLVIDNVEAIDSGEVIRFYDAMPDTGSLLLTSRVGLGQLERRLAVGPLESDAGAKMLRLLAQRRGVPQLAQLDHKVLSEQVDRLRATPLAIRWFVEAVGSGADPHVAISDQSELLRFCLETIYADLSELARLALSVMYAAGTPLDAAQLAVMTDSAADQLARALQDLQRRSLTEVSIEGDAGLHQRYAPTAATAQYLASVDRPSSEILQAAETRLAELRASEEHRQRGVATSVSFISVLDDSQKAVAHLLRKAVVLSKRDSEEAKSVLSRADGLSPGYFETARIEAYIAAQEDRYDAADMLYRRSYELAPDEFHKARVAYFWSWTKAFSLGELREGLALAAEAANTLSTPATTARLAQVQIASGQFSEAEALLRSVLGSDDARAILIARTLLIRLAKSRVERHVREKAIGEAVRLGAAAVVEAGAYLDTGIADRTLRVRVLDLALETLNAYLRAPSVVPEKDIAKIISYGLRHSTELLLSADRQYWQRAAQRCAARDDVPPSVVTSIQRLLSTVQEKEDKEVLHGKIFSFDDDAGYGFITQPQSVDRVFFHRSDLADPKTAVLLVREVPVTFTAHHGERGLRARKVATTLSRNEENEMLVSRRLHVYKREELHAFAQDAVTRASVYIDSRATPGFQWDRIREGVELLADLELSAKGPRVKTGTLRAAAPSK